MIARLSALMFAVLVLAGANAAAVDLEDYARLPRIQDVELSPNGEMIAYILNEPDQQHVVVQRADGLPLRRVSFEISKIRDVDWAGDEYVLIVRSVASVGPIRSEVPQLGRLNVATGHLRHLLGVHPGVLGRGQWNGRPILFTPANPRGIFRVDLETGNEIEHFDERDSFVYDYIVRPNGEVLAREWYNNDRQTWGLSFYENERWREIMSVPAPIDRPNLIGLTPDESAVLVNFWDEAEQVWRPRSVALGGGDLGAPIAPPELLGVLLDEQRHMIGLVRTPLFTQYDFVDPALDETWSRVTGSFPDSQVILTSHSADYRRLVVFVDGPGRSGIYFLYDAPTQSLTQIGAAYPEVGPTDIAEVRFINYRAADGLNIPAFLTLPPGRPARNLPLVVMPHSGPEARDVAGFDWIAQALASRGYAVLQPNFRGSTGYGYAHLSAGYGEWGRKMQTDLSDGVAHLAAQGTVDRSRVCIMGQSYGGYAALAGVTLQQGIYRCAVSIAGITDMREWVGQEIRLGASEHSRSMRATYRYLGIRHFTDPSLRAISPFRHAAAADAPILLIHGRDDGTVPFSHSTNMERALRNAGRPVELVELRDEDHFLSREPSRIQALTAAVEFIERHNPPD
jgi:dienelactone hydrolase